jgi:uncharacterized membrane protein
MIADPRRVDALRREQACAIRDAMTWGIAFRVRQYLRGSLWVVPFLGAFAGALLGTIDMRIEQSVTLPAYWQYSPTTASTVLASVVGSTAALTGFVVTVTVLVVQMATGTFSARYMRLWYRDRMLKAVLAMLVGTLTFSFSLLRRVESDFVPDIGVTVSGFLIASSLVLFMLFLDRYLHRLRPVAVAALVADAGRKAFRQAVEATADADGPDLHPGPYSAPGPPTRVVRSHRAGSIQAIDGRGLVRVARHHNCLLVLPHVVGDFIPEDGTLIEIHGQAEVDDRHLRGMVALGVERTIEQDPAFAVRIMVDVAVRALSAAVNDPTTAVQVLDHLGDTLRLIGSTDMEGPPEGAGTPRPGQVVIRSRGWPEYLALAVTEIREYGAGSIQVNRRLRAMLEELREEVSVPHRVAVLDELARLDASVARSFGDSPDFDRALAADRQGIGGPA